jgi:hypothetical protein
VAAGREVDAPLTIAQRLEERLQGRAIVATTAE